LCLLSNFNQSHESSLKFIKSSRYAWVAGLLAVFSGVYLVYASIPETFVLYLVLGGLIWLLILKNDWDAVPSRTVALRAGLLGIGILRDGLLEPRTVIEPDAAR